MKALICVFSGTGNTLRVCEQISEQLSALGVETDIHSIRIDSSIPDVSAYDTLIVGYPVHAFNTPTAVSRFLKKLSKTDGKAAYTVRVSGEPLRLNDASAITPRRILRKKGYSVRGEFSYVMPYNIIFRHSDGMVARMWQDALLRVKADSKAIASGEGKIQKVNIFRRFVSFVLRIEHTAMPIIGKHFRVKAECAGCGICAKKCPQNNIVIEGGKPKFGKKCVGCMGCAFSCPKDAIKTAILNGWRVNGDYSFDGVPATDEQVCSYCKKAYLRYFHETEKQDAESNI